MENQESEKKERGSGQSGPESGSLRVQGTGESQGVLEPIFAPLVEAFEFEKYELAESQGRLMALLERIHGGDLTRLEVDQAEESEGLRPEHRPDLGADRDRAEEAGQVAEEAAPAPEEGGPD